MKKWDPSKLPFLEEKLEFRRKSLDGLDHEGTVLCVYAGGEARLTKMYASKFAKVIAVDKSLPKLPENVVSLEVSDKVFLNSLEIVPNELQVLDIDPYGSPMPFLKKFINKYTGNIRRLILTDGLLTSIKMKRKINLYKHYGLKPERAIKAERWHYDHFQSLVFSGIKDLVQKAGYCISYFDWEYNRYRTAIYARFDLVR